MKTLICVTYRFHIKIGPPKSAKVATLAKFFNASICFSARQPLSYQCKKKISIKNLGELNNNFLIMLRIWQKKF